MVALLLGAFWAGPMVTLALFVLLSFVGLIELLILTRALKAPSHRSKKWFWRMAAPLWIAVPLCGFVDLFSPFSPQLATGWFVLIWAQDTGAYLVGTAIGRHKMWPRLSPGKTWEGWLGGTAITLALASQMPAWTAQFAPVDQLASAEWLTLAALIAVFGTLGDLLESVLKRQCGAADSGSIFPGHGGVLDRFDAVFLAAPACYIYLHLL